MYDRDKNGKLHLTPALQKKACQNYDKMMKSNAQVAAVAGAGAVPGTANVMTGGGVSWPSRLSTRLGGPITTFFTGMTGAVTTVLGFAPAPEGCK